MMLSSIVWTALAALAAISITIRVLRGLRIGQQTPGAALCVACALLILSAFLARYHAVQKEDAERRFHAGLEARRQRELARADPTKQGTPSPPAVTTPAGILPRPLEPGTHRETPSHRAGPVRIVDYALDLSLFPDRHSLSARAEFTVVARMPIDRIELALSPEFRVHALHVNGAPVTFLHTNDLVSFPYRLREGKAATLAVRYSRRVSVPLLRAGDLIDPRGIYLRPESRWYPSVGELDFHAPLRLSARVPRGMTVVSSGQLVRKSVEASTVTFHWESIVPVRMICLAAGRYAHSRNADGPVAIETFLHPNHASRARAYQETVQRIVRFYASRFGAYPYPKLTIAEIPVFPGGYGSTALLLLTEKSFAEKEIPTHFLAHEIAHQWWGNHVAPQGLGAGWLSEAFAEYSAVLYQEHAGGPKALQEALAGLEARYQTRLREGTEEAIAETDPYDQSGAYEGTVYYKGAYVLHSLRCLIGEEQFRRLLRLFAERYGAGTARIADFEALAGEVHGKPLTWFFDQWLRRPGAPRLRVAVAKEGPPAVLTVVQEGAPYRGEMQLLVTDGAGKTRHTLHLDGSLTRVKIPVRGTITRVEIDPDRAWLLHTPQRVHSL
ncbi:MAG TPA: M1 family aminopeptidase [Armatimonadota bacterium]|jgi:aminopeptidase N|nr:M1 family aminopeptidase [Armatimonadota bacterium]HOM83597.1 M1 family aminopeptidase [Armatimonadota bacterium]HPO72372.1 M1 family aminopeptidase [Armatimonadota bacterium]